MGLVINEAMATGRCLLSATPSVALRIWSIRTPESCSPGDIDAITAALEYLGETQADWRR